jgi:serine/threonine-protein kinase
MSPEQVAGEPLDRRSDIYSLGVTLYLALTGRHPLPLPPHRPLEAILRLHQNATPRPMREAAPELDLPPALDALVLQTLARRREDRPPTMAALADALAALTVVPPPAPPTPRNTPWLAVLAALVTGWTAASLLQRPAAAPPTDAPPGRLPPVPEASLAPPVLEASLSPPVPEAGRPAAPVPEDSRPGSPAPAPGDGPRAREFTAAAVAALTACHHTHGGGEGMRLKVEVVVSAAGRPSRVDLPDLWQTPESACMREVLRALRFPPGAAPRTLRRSFRLPPASRPR